MSFLAGYRLWLLLLVAVLGLAYVLVQRQRRQYAVRFTNVDLLASVAPRRPGWRRHLAAACSLLALVLIVMAFARPARAIQVPRETATVMLAVDVSQSMRATDVEPSRIQAAKRAVRAFVDSLPTRFRLGLVAFAGNAQVLVPPTHQRSLVRSAVANLQLQQQTAIGEGIFASIDAIENSPLDKGKRPPARIVLLSDGATNAGRPNSEAAAAAKKKGMRVSTIAFGTDSGTVVVQDADPEPAGKRGPVRADAVDEARPDHEVRLTALERREQRRDLRRVVLPVAVQADGPVEPLLERVPEPRLHGAADADIEREPEDRRPARFRDGRRVVRGGVVHDDDLRRGTGCPDLVDDPSDRAGLIEGRDDGHDRRARHAATPASSPTSSRSRLARCA